MLLSIVKIILFPGLLFLGVFAFFLEFLDRKVYARMQSRMGPPWYQPLADFLKLIGKRVILPRHATRFTYRILPIVALTAVAASFVCIPVFGTDAVATFEGDLVVVLYFLAIPPICLFLAGWDSRDLYTVTGAFRTLTQMFAYEVPLFLLLLAPAILAGTWSINGIVCFYAAHPLWTVFNIPALLCSLIVAQSKLERPPFDAPEAETEIVGGALVEYSGRYLALFRLTSNCEMVVVFSLIAALFLPFVTGTAWVDFLLYLAKVIVLVLISTGIKVSMARLRVDQVMNFCWKILTPIAIAQIVLNIIIGGTLVI